MKKLIDLILHKKAVSLDATEMQQIKSERIDKCGYSPHYSDMKITCVSSAEEAEEKAGENGWWCCNCEALKDIC